ncbi:putative leucine-rich repeat receptor-like serine/threonine-protein kinase At2g14440 [Chenopodium quinoa]|uniref:putative leucine-rich repeat receptor-like serine/threonine-protein kinase At2g14440 n=1 Tax=Chenopodium quinoa TaxID=63459 RepID=UPI000B77C7DB|nr:putative leucine-rich repeat receptor-like serine/threonine-protein kinase At2g14440 [Chenopodium quinoa]
MSPFILSFFFLLLSPPLSLSTPFNISYHIDCGGSTTFTDHFKTTWLSDRYYTGGSTSVVSEPLQFSLQQEKTLRFFPPTTTGPKNCYILPTAVHGGRYLFRTFTTYDNYDGKNHPPSFEVSVEGTVVFSYQSPWAESLSSDGFYSDLIAFVHDGDADVCFYSIATDPPIIGTLEVVEIDPDSYDASNLGNDTVLVNYGRLSCGQEQWGPGLSNDTDFVWRSWQSDAKFRSKNMKGPKVISTTTAVNGANQKPNYFPTKLYQHAVTVGNSGVLEYELTVDAKLDYLLWFHFAEIDSKVTKAGQRVFDVQVNGENVNRIDVYKAVGGFKAHDWHYVAKNLSSTSLTVKLAPVVGEPILSGLEAYAIVPNDLATVPDQVVAMRALKDSLRIPGRMGWNGDPCAPATWNAWEGVICRTNKEGNALVISQIDLGSQGLKGFISDRISLLTNLAVLNLSSNSLTGSLPEGLGQQSLVKLDLSNNELTGSIPDSLATSRNLRLVLLNDNKLEGRVPEEIYSVGVHGGAIDLSANKGLCGMPSLPECPLFWSNGQLSRGGKIGIGLSCMVVVMVLLLVAYICIRRKRNDYDFGLPHELMSMAAKRNRYHRQKSLMVLEMESQHAKGLIPPSKPQ